MRYLLILVILACAVFSTNNTQANDEIAVIDLAKGSVGWNGAGFRYPDGKPEITVKKLVITPEDGEKVVLAAHCHPIPAAAYILKGSVTVIDSSGSKQTFKEGDGVIDIMNVWHRGIFPEPAELIVFYAGAVGIPLSVEKGSNSEFAKRCSHGMAGDL